MPDKKPRPYRVQRCPRQPGTDAGDAPTNVQVIYTQNPVHFSKHPVPIHCPACHRRIMTYVVFRSGVATWLASLGFCIFGVWFGCCFIPFCFDVFKDAEHFCPVCRTHIGTSYRM